MPADKQFVMLKVEVFNLEFINLRDSIIKYLISIYKRHRIQQVTYQRIWSEIFWSFFKCMKFIYQGCVISRRKNASYESPP